MRPTSKKIIDNAIDQSLIFALKNNNSRRHMVDYVYLPTDVSEQDVERIKKHLEDGVSPQIKMAVF